MTKNKQLSDVVEEWVKEQLQEGEDPEIIKESLVILNQDPSIVDKVLASQNKASTEKRPTKKKKKEEKNIEEKVENLKKEIKEEILSAPPEKVIDTTPPRMNIPKESLPNKESIYVLEHKKPLSNAQIKEIMLKHYIKNKLPYAIIFLGISLIIIGTYIYLYL